MANITLSEQDKKELLEYLNKVTRNISEKEIAEIDSKLNKKISSLRKKKGLPSYVEKMISQIYFLKEKLEEGLSEACKKKIIAGLHYFIMAEDRIPDYIPVVGYLDDAFVVSVVYSDIKKNC